MQKYLLTIVAAAMLTSPFASVGLCDRAALLARLAPKPPNAHELRARFEHATKELTFFCTGDFVYARPTAIQTMSQDTLDQYNDTLSRVVGPQGYGEPSARDIERFVPLLKHDSAKVRTLAAAAIYHTEAPQAIHLLAALLDDNATTFPHPQRIALAIPLPGDAKVETPMKPQTVADVARQFLRAMVGASHGNFRLDDPKRRADSLERFWATRKNRKRWIGWYAFRLQRATQGRRPVREDRMSRVYSLAAQIDQLPPVQREIYLLAIFGQPDRRGLIGDNLLQFAARRLGPDRLLQLATGKPVINDPDLPAYLGHLQRYIYAQATDQLRPRDADAVLALARQSKHIDAYIAAADLAPKRSSAVAILHEAFEAKLGKHDGWARAQAAIALWRVVGAGEEGFLAQWFFNDRSPEMGRTPYRGDFVAFLLDRFTAADRKLLAQILRDDRFDQIDLPTLRLIVRDLNRNLLHPVVDPKKLRNVSHPFGDFHFNAKLDSARKQYPKETDALLDHMANWREGLRASIERWERS